MFQDKKHVFLRSQICNPSQIHQKIVNASLCFMIHLLASVFAFVFACIDPCEQNKRKKNKLQNKKKYSPKGIIKGIKGIIWIPRVLPDVLLCKYTYFAYIILLTLFWKKIACKFAIWPISVRGFIFKPLLHKTWN